MLQIFRFSGKDYICIAKTIQPLKILTTVAISVLAKIWHIEIFFMQILTKDLTFHWETTRNPYCAT
ncbi:MAG: hypothetical protein A3D96_00825 [Chlamydiae bacterium RIFCSPHIGHO2_12_FULL_44_59]|nr:MAG: hypothetical protein A2796_00400 [Chlamydiae bacterium RIFCSPHIGHO2_01_FULL_44_39]OGN60414.1 MAG: hypothetical protein A3D96_00825 [Chlamydiae bacterium RIFCSPHIGHO2_12_FULL_44_59]OGN66535.1 MAG: hypothetical protein A2978_05010 [Chlamydiae bacterium RIFCSPLOWO2_01_FULL_44_52]OGN69785.1 MAG: hypothetical protein A3I67_06765 [Chlamydiae bacterium RIFCSPLOWO2_02_FULL_45_22]OGN70325.1 MAG: hypothetical protein A3F79_00135 [Chlamydiae bacterium RIFCSPLOWO2_12_FULL_45_20]